MGFVVVVNFEPPDSSFSYRCDFEIYRTLNKTFVSRWNDGKLIDGTGLLRVHPRVVRQCPLTVFVKFTESRNKISKISDFSFCGYVKHSTPLHKKKLACGRAV